MSEGFVIGIDVGTGGVRAVAADGAGAVLAQAEASLPRSASPQPGWVEQRPEDWWTATCAALRTLSERLGARRMGGVAGLCVDSTSGTVLAVDDAGRPLTPALMYNDARASAEAEELNRIGADLTRRMGYRFNSSYGLAKILWLVRHSPEARRAARFVNAADFLAGRLCGQYGVTDYTNALKMGYDLLEDCRPTWLPQTGVEPGHMPRVVRTGQVIGAVSQSAARASGLRAGAPVAAGPTDGVASFYASGATAPGEAATTLGTTLVVKSLSRSIVLDPQGRIYSHRHALGWWLPGGASNCGCEYASKFFPSADLNALGREAEAFLPCRILLYPLARKGERFPSVCATAERFVSSEPSCAAEHFAAYLQAVAFVERWSYDLIAELGGNSGGSVMPQFRAAQTKGTVPAWGTVPFGERGGQAPFPNGRKRSQSPSGIERPETESLRGSVFTSGGGSRSDVWMQLRADVLGRAIECTEAPDSAFGSAVLAASGSLFGSLEEATRRMVRRSRRFEPRPERRGQYDDLYLRFRDECARRGIG